MTSLAARLARACALGLLIVATTPADGSSAPGNPARRKVDPALWATADRSGSHEGDVQIIIRTKPGAAPNVRAHVERHGTLVRGVHPLMGVLTATVHGGDLDALAAEEGVEHISLDSVVRGLADPPSHVETRSASAGLRASLGLPFQQITGNGVGVALLDSGVQRGGVNPVAFYDFIRGGGRAAAYDDYGHGTHVAGLIAAAGRDAYARERGAGGIAPGVRLSVFKVLDGRGEGRTSTVIHALEFIVANRAQLRIDVVNLSLGHAVTQRAADDPLVEAVERATRAGLVVVVAAGNLGAQPTSDGPRNGGITSPGNAPSAITVGALDTKHTVSRRDDSVAPYSSQGPTAYDRQAKPDLVAPGHNLVSHAAVGSFLYEQYPLRRVSDPAARVQYFRLSGSSMAAAVTTGVVALLIEQHRAVSRLPLTSNVIKAILQFTALPVEGSEPVGQGAGALNASGAVGLLAAIDPSHPVGDYWATSAVTPITLIGDESYVWNQTVIWGDTVIWGNTVLAHETAWSGSAVWGSTVIWGNAVAIVPASYAGATVTDTWTPTTDVGSETVIWGNSDDDTVVWGNSLP
jgi:serine protease AprX